MVHLQLPTRQRRKSGQKPNASQFDAVGTTLGQKNKEQEKVRFEGVRVVGWVGFGP